MDNQEKIFIDRTTDMQEQFDLLSKKAGEQVNSQAIIFKQQMAKHENIFTKLKKGFKNEIAMLVEKFDKLHKQTKANFGAFEKFLQLAAPYNKAVDFWEKKKEEHGEVRKSERKNAVYLAIGTAIIFIVTAYFMFRSSEKIEEDFPSIISLIMSFAEAADSPTLCDALACEPVSCSPMPSAPELCATAAGSTSGCNLLPCGSVDCQSVDCRAVDCKAVDCKAVDCKAVPCKAAIKEMVTKPTTATSPTVNMANVTINSYLNKSEKTSMLQKPATIPTGKLSNGTKSDFLDNLWKISILFMISTLGFWLTRVSARGFVSNQHLEMDCRERITILFTYFALQESESPLRGNERPIVLETLFRPGTTGLIKDDGPANILETLIKATKKR